MNWGGVHLSLLPGDRRSAHLANMECVVPPPVGLCVDPERPS